MLNRLREWLRPDRPLGGGAYALVGVTAFAIKFNGDRLFARFVFHRTWHLLDYWSGANAFYLWDLHKQDARFFACMLAMALPFIAFGVTMTLRRLTALKFSPWLVIFFFLPVLNLLFFALLTLGGEIRGFIPPPRAQAVKAIGFLIPSTALGSCLASAVLVSLLGTALVGFDVMVLKQYGWSLFVLLPFVHGMAASWFYAFHQRRGLVESQLVASLSSVLTGLFLLSFAIEGAVCVAMAAPLWLTLAGIGAWVGWGIQEAHWRQTRSALLMFLGLVIVPFLMGAEYAANPKAPLLHVSTSIAIDAPPERVWDYVVSFSELPSPQEWIFKTGIAYPVRAHITGEGKGAIRRCEFSTGAFLEPIEVWQRPSLLKFAVTENPPPMHETSFYSQIDPPHLHGFLIAKHGQFQLVSMADGGTRLEGTTWYEHHLWPARYWQFWSDYIIHQIHLRVLKHIKALAENRMPEGLTHG